MCEYSINSVIKFGDYNWRILDAKDSMILIITDDIITQQPFNKKAGNVTWAECSIREYLNNEFYNNFSETERSRITPVLNKNNDNPWYGSFGGEDTLDRIFLLSLEEVVCQYFGDSSMNLKNRSAKQRYWFQKKDKNNIKRRAILDSSIWWWWLRSPGRDNKRAIYIHGDGNVGIQGNLTYKYSSQDLHPTGDNSGGIRPALWLNL